MGMFSLYPLLGLLSNCETTKRAGNAFTLYADKFFKKWQIELDVYNSNNVNQGTHIQRKYRKNLTVSFHYYISCVPLRTL